MEPATRLLYLESMERAYERAFEANVVRRGADHVVLDQTLFYPEGGGQESDAGTLTWDGGSARVLRVEKKGSVLHRLDVQAPAEGTRVRGAIDWDRRHAHMRMHTSQHLISGLAYDLFGARTVGNQLHADRSRIDLRPARWGDAEVERLVAAANAVLGEPRPVRITFESRASLEARLDVRRANLDLLPAHVQEVRVVEIEGLDAGPCGGTHVQNLEEIGRIRLLGRSAKGAESTRVEYALEPPAGA